jgi:hypothetical protein
MDTQFVPPVRNAGQRKVQWEYNHWPDSQEWDNTQWVKSPRRRQSPRQRSRKGMPHNQTAKGKGHPKQSDEQPQYGPQSLPTMQALEPPWTTALSSTATTNSGPVFSLASDGKDDKDRQMRSLVAALRKHQDNLPDDVQALMKDVSIRTGQEETKQMHAAVSQHGRAKREVADAQSARLHMHQAWKNFLAQSVQQWTAYTNQFMTQEKELMDRLKLAQENLIIAKDNLGSCKSAAGLAAKDDASMTSDTEDVIAKEAESAAGQQIAASFKDLATSLQALHTQAAQAVQQEADQQDQHRKRPRIAAPGEKDLPEVPVSPNFGEGE